jgi:hypothetical protein
VPGRDVKRLKYLSLHSIHLEVASFFRVLTLFDILIIITGKRNQDGCVEIRAAGARLCQPSPGAIPSRSSHSGCFRCTGYTYLCGGAGHYCVTGS